MSNAPFSIGQPVWFHPEQAARRGDHDYPLAATIVYPNEDGTVNLVAYDHNGVPSGELSVPMWDGTGERPIVDFAEAITDDKVKAAKPRRLKDEKIEDYHTRLAAWHKAKADAAKAAAGKAEAPGGALVPEGPSKETGESNASYRDRVEAWRKEEQAKIEAAHAGTIKSAKSEKSDK